jgi:serine/threonine-protein kinase
MRQLCAGLDFIHARGYVHRDIKTGNIFVSPDGLATILDFGILRVRGKEVLTRAGAVMGTPQYMSPEQALGLEDVDHRADLYALAVVLFECMTGSLPFETGSDLQLIQAHAHLPPPDPTQFLPTIPRPVAQMMMRALAKRREDRFPSAAEFLTAFEVASAGHLAPGLGDVPGDPHTLPSWRRRAATPQALAAEKVMPGGRPAPPVPLQGRFGSSPTPTAPGEPPVPWPTPASAANAGTPAHGVPFDTAEPKRPRRALLFAVAAALLIPVAAGLLWARTFANAEALNRPPPEANAALEPLADPPPREPEATYIDASIDLSELLVESQTAEVIEPVDAGLQAATAASSDAGWSVGNGDADAELRLVEAGDPKPRTTQTTKRVGKKAAAYGKLNVITLHRGEPYWAQVKVDGVVRGRTPLLLELPVGAHVIHVERAGFSSQQREVNVAQGEGAVLRIRLRP